MATFDELTRMLNNSQTQAGSPNRGGPGNPGGVNNTAPGRPTPPAASTPASPGAYDNYIAQLERMYSMYYGGQNPAFGRYRPPTLGGDGSDPRNWNDVGGYAYNLPNNFGPAQTSWTQMNPFRRPNQRELYTDSFGGEEAYAARQAARNATAAAGQPNRGPAYVGPQETHVGGQTYPTKEPGVVDGGTKGPYSVQDEQAALEDWEFRRNRGRGNRWGRY